MLLLPLPLQPPGFKTVGDPTGLQPARPIRKSANELNAGCPTDPVPETDAPCTRSLSKPNRNVCFPWDHETWSPTKNWLKLACEPKKGCTPNHNMPVVAEPLTLMNDILSTAAPGVNGETKSWMPSCELWNKTASVLTVTFRWYAAWNSFTTLFDRIDVSFATTS